jgi:hypothetical protein
MGRTYWFECVKCGYRAKVSGGADRGFNLFVQTIVCRDCRNLCDAVIRMKVSARFAVRGPNRRGVGPATESTIMRPSLAPAPRFQEAANRLLYMGTPQLQWVQFKLRCPVSALHKIEPWNEPGKCPQCGLLLEKNVLPFRIWD